MPPARTVTKDAHALQALSNLSLDSSPFPAFPSFQPMCTLGIFAWEPKGVEKKLAELTVSDILGGLGSARLPVTIQIPQIRGRTFFKSHLPPQRVPNGFPNNPGYVVPLFVAMSRFGVGLDDIDFVLGGSGLHVLATQVIERSNNEPDDTKYLVQRVGNVLLLAKSKSYVQDFSDVGFQFERFVTAGCMEDAHDLTHFESLHIMRIGEFRVLFAAECDAVEQGRLRGAGRDQGGEPALLRPEGRVPTSLRACTHARMHGCVHTCLCASMKQVMFQMISSGAEVLVQADKRGKELLGIKRRTISELIGEHPQSKLRVSEQNIASNLGKLRALGAKEGAGIENAPWEIDFDAQGKMTMKPCPSRELLPPASVVQELLAKAGDKK